VSVDGLPPVSKVKMPWAAVGQFSTTALTGKRIQGAFAANSLVRLVTTGLAQMLLLSRANE